MKKRHAVKKLNAHQGEFNSNILLLHHKIQQPIRFQYVNVLIIRTSFKVVLICIFI